MDIRETYLAAWNETDREARDGLLEATWSPGATYVDPLASAAGLAAISAVIGAVHDQFPGLVFSPVGEVDAHHEVARFRWGLGLPGQEPVAVGFDVVSSSAQGRIEAVTGFLDVVPGA